jgi:DNA-directed RNA polymerase specialized sigma24 family protein
MRQILAFAPRVGTSQRLVVVDLCAPSIFERISRELEPYLEHAAESIAAEFPAAVDDMVQEARIRLWELDLGRFSQREAAYLRRILFNCMIDVHDRECRGGLTSSRPTHPRWLLEELVPKF